MKNKMFSLALGILVLLSVSFSWAQKRRAIESSNAPTSLTYDLSASVGSYNNNSYTELNLGLNWYMQEWLNWRNALFTRFGSNIDSVTGLDSSARFSQTFRSDTGSFGLDLFIGPGLRFASQSSNAIFGEAGVAFKLGGLYIGGGVKSLYYTAERKDSAGNVLSHNDNQFFIILSGGGAL